MSATTQQIPPLSTLKDWDRDDWEQYDPCLWGGEPSQKKVIKTIIRAADRELHWRGEQNANSLRDFWYNPTKPILQRAFPEKEADPEFNFSRRMSQYLSSALSELVKEGETSYRSLNILDESRERDLNLDGPEQEKILFVEKAAAYRKLRPLENVYELSIVSGGGWQATALIEDLAHELDPHRSYTLYLLTDYDPTGWKIGRDFRQRAERLGVSIDDVKRVGILPRQLDGETRRRQRFVPAVQSESDRDWMDTHAIYGEYGLEIEAVGDLNQKGEALREIVVDELRGEIDVRARRERDTNRALESAAENAIEWIIRDITSDLQLAIGDAAADVLDGADGVEDFSIYGLAAEAAVDLDVAVDGREWLPNPYDADELHKGAVADDRPTVSEAQAVNYITERVREQIQSGDLDLAEHLDLGGDDA